MSQPESALSRQGLMWSGGRADLNGASGAAVWGARPGALLGDTGPANAELRGSSHFSYTEFHFHADLPCLISLLPSPNNLPKKGKVLNSQEGKGKPVFPAGVCNNFHRDGP